MVEKFKVEMVLLRYVVVGCYVLDCVIFDVLCCIDQGVGGEVQFIDVIVLLIVEGYFVYVVVY